MNRIVMGLALLSSTSAFAVPVCPTTSAEITALGTYTGDTTGLTSNFTSTCGGSSGDYQYEFIAPTAAVYVFSTAGTGYDTILSAFSTADCTTQLACNDDFSGLTSEVSLTLAAGERVLINVDGFGGATGPYTLTITDGGAPPPPPVCAFDADLGSQVNITVTGDTTGGTSGNTSLTCGFNTDLSPDDTWRWVAPATGTYFIDTNGTAHDTVLSITDTSCNETSCNDDNGAGGLWSLIELQATAGTEYWISVDGYNGDFGPYTLNLYDAANCPDADGDGTCDAQDLCTGDDATGDSDSDGICDDTDFSLNVSTVRPGQSLQLQASNVAPGTNVFFFVSTAGPGQGPCAPAGSPCLDIRQPTRLGQATANANGNANLTVTVPAAAVPGRNVGFQAAFVVNGGDTTEVEARQIQP